MKRHLRPLLYRIVSIGALTLAVLSPKIPWRHGGPDPHLAVVWDESASMSETDTLPPLSKDNLSGAGSPQTRWTQARAAFEKARGAFSPVTFHHFLLASGIRPTDETRLSAMNPSASASNGGGLGALLPSSGVQAILLFSDGRFGDGDVAPPGIPVFAVGVGGAGNAPDVSVESVASPPLAYAGLPVTVSVQMAASLPLPSPVRAVLTENGIRRDQTSALFSSGTATVSFTFRPARAGLAQYAVQVDPVLGETRTANNVRVFSLDVQRNRLRTLYIAGRPGPHYNFLRAQLKNDPSVELVSFVVLRDPEDVLPYFDGELSLIPFPTSAALMAQLPTFDVVVLEEISGIRLGMGDAFFSALEKWVRSGGGFLSIHVPDDGVRGEPVGNNLLARPDPWAPGPTVSGPERFRLKLTNPSHPVLSLADGPANESRWARLTPLEGEGAFFPGVISGAHVLAVESVTGAPVLAERSFGRGRVMGLAHLTSWRWALDGGRRGEGPADYQRFWENMIRWLAGTPGSGSLRFIRPGEFQLRTQEIGEVRLQAPPDLSHPPRLWAVGPNGKKQNLPVRKGEQKGIFTADFIPTDPGTYELHAESESADRDRLQIHVSSDWDERLDTRVDFRRLQKLARDTGGDFVDAGQLDKKTIRRWRSKMSIRPDDPSRPEGRRGSLLFGALALGALIMEWVFRRRQGLP